MTSRPSVPEGEVALKLFNQLQTLSQDLLEAGHARDAAKIEQLVIQRGMVLEQAGRLMLKDLPEEVQAQLREKIRPVEAMEPEIDRVLRSFHARLGDQLKASKNSKALMQKYKFDNPGTTHSHEA